MAVLALIVMGGAIATVFFAKPAAREPNHETATDKILTSDAPAGSQTPTPGLPSTTQATTPEPPVQPAPASPQPAPVPIGEPEPELPVSASPAPQPKAEPPAPKPQAKPTPAIAPATQAALDEAATLRANGKLVAARDLLNRYLATEKLRGGEGEPVRAAIVKLNETLVFSPQVTASDPLAAAYTVQDGDRLGTIARPTHVPWRFMERINGVNPDRIRSGQTLKLIQGPFHAVVYKSEFRMDMYLGDPSRPGSTYIRSFRVGLGEGDGTPTGRFIVKTGKTADPAWTNPRTAQHYKREDPKNPIGEYWIGLRGLDAASARHLSYGIHGTIDPDSIGKQASMGCVRLLAQDIALAFDMLDEEQSTVTIVQ